MKKAPLLIFLIFFSITSNGKNKSITNIYKDANAIINNYEESFKVFSASNATRTINYSITILNEAGDNYSTFYEFYDEFRRVKIQSAKIYNSHGEKIKTINKRDFADQSMFSGYSLFDDNRILYYKPQVKKYPYTITYKYKINYSGLISYPSWIPHMNYNIAVKESSFEVIIPNKIGLHYKTKNMDTKPAITRDKIQHIYKWEVKNQNAIRKEELATTEMSLPMVKIAPDNFEVKNYKGRLETWQSFGNWVHTLLDKRQELTATEYSKLSQIISPLKTDKEKISRIYEYVQSNTRYVSIQMGIGGWQPFDAETVTKVGYGDCKALSNYTMALLEAADIPAHYALIYSSNNPFYFESDFQSNQFNHAIVCVPNNGDTIWLETTSKINPTGYLGAGNSNREALLITQSGGKLVKTPHYTAKQNKQKQITQIKLHDNGDATITASTRYEGLQFDFYLNQEDKNVAERKEWLLKNLDFNNFKIIDSDYKRLSEEFPVGERNLKVQVHKYAQKSGNRFFIPINEINKTTYIPQKLENRQNDILINFSYYDIDSVCLEFPENYDIEYLPNPVSFISKIGTYTTKTIKKNNCIYYIRRLRINKGIYPKEYYQDIRNFYKKIVKADKAKLILVSKQEI